RLQGALGRRARAGARHPRGHRGAGAPQRRADAHPRCRRHRRGIGQRQAGRADLRGTGRRPRAAERARRHAGRRESHGTVHGALRPDDAAAARAARLLRRASRHHGGYGTPSAAIYGDANNDGVFDDKTTLLGLNVQKYGRTTKLTHGQITGINATVDVCYEVFIIFCVKSARFVDQLVIEPGSFSGGGDSGSLIVTDDQNKNPVGLLFAGSSTQTIANRIDLVLNNFGVHVDGGAPPPPPTAITDVAVTSVTAPASVTQGAAVNVGVTVKNVGNQPVGAFAVTLQEAPDGAPFTPQTVTSLSAGAQTTLTFSWGTSSTTSIGSHTLNASHNLTDDNAT